MKKLFLTLTLSLIATTQASPKVDQDFLKAVSQASMKKINVTLTYGAYINAIDDAGNTALHLAAELGDLDLVQFLLEKGADLDTVNNDGYTILHAAAKQGNPHLVKFLLDKGLDPNPEEGKQILPLATENGHFLATYLLLAYGAEEKLYYWGNSAGDYAYENGYYEICSLLFFFNRHSSFVPSYYKDLLTAMQGSLKLTISTIVSELKLNNMDLNIQDRDGNTPLHYAVDHDAVDIVRDLLDLGAEINIANSYRETPLHSAASWSPVTSEIVRLLLENGADVTAEDCSGRTPLMKACNGRTILRKFVQVDEVERTLAHLEIINLLLQYRASANKQSTTSKTPLHYLGEGGWSEGYGYFNDSLEEDYEDLVSEEFERRAVKVAQLLINNGADVNAQSKRGTPLHKATFHKELAAFLLEKGADVHQKDRKGSTPLHNCSLEVAQLLVTYGADIHATDSKGNTPLHRGKYIEGLPAFLLSKGAAVNVRNNGGQTLLHNCSSEVARLLINHGAEVNAADNRGNTPLHEEVSMVIYGEDDLAKHDSYEKTVLLLNSGANVNQRNLLGATPFHYVSTPEIAELLLDHGANLHETDNDGNTVLHYAINCETIYNPETDTYEPTLLQFLLGQGSVLNQQNAQGETPLHKVARNYWDGEQKLCLLEYGADPYIQDNKGNTPQQLAEQQQYYDCCVEDCCDDDNYEQQKS